MIQAKQDIQRQLDQAYQALRNLKDQKAVEGWQPDQAKTQRILEGHIRYLKSLLRGAS